MNETEAKSTKQLIREWLELDEQEKSLKLKLRSLASQKDELARQIVPAIGGLPTGGFVNFDDIGPFLVGASAGVELIKVQSLSGSELK